uniref:VWFA domain-containing protein n=1 Tax=Plectus sambesii TaxID=2011161 RepID=A0A914V9Z5_9BILA
MLKSLFTAVSINEEFSELLKTTSSALSNEITELNGQRSGVAQITVLFTSTSVQADVTKALPSATQLKSSGTTIIVVGIGSNVIPSILTPLASNPSLVFTASDFTSLASNTALANQINTAIGICGGSITQSTASGTPSASTPSITPPSTPSVTTPSSATSLPTTPSTGPTPDPTRRDIIILMDTSSGLGSVANFQAELNFIASVLVANWTVGPIHVEVDPVVYDSDSFQEIGAFTFKDTAELQQAIAAIAAMPDFLSDPPSIAYALNHSSGVSSQRSGAPQTIILFSST